MKPPADAPPALRSLDLEAHLADPARKQQFVTPMFDLIAPRYDEFTRRFSFGMDAGWKRLLVDRAADAIPRDGIVVDVACGTADLAFALARRRDDLRLTGIDASRRMLDLAARRRDIDELRPVALLEGDLSRLPFPDGSVDAVTGGYAFRNAPSWREALVEAARVLRPGGQLFTLDFYRPALAAWRAPWIGYLWVAGCLVGWRWHREPVAYGYIARSIEHFTSWQGFSRGLEAAGFDVRPTATRLLGAIAVHQAVKR